MTIRPRTAMILTAAALTLTSCTATPPTPTAPTATTTPNASDRGDHDVLVPHPTATPDHEAAAVAAIDAMTAFADRDLDYTTWFEQLRPHLYPTAVEAYGTVNPSRIPPIDVLGTAEVADTSTDTYAVAYVRTSIGEYTIELRRDTPTDRWGVTRFQPPA